MNKIKEKKLNSIKSQLNEINEFVKVNVNDEVQKKVGNNNDKENDTLILTKIVNYRDKEQNTLHNIDEIKDELNIIKLMLIKQEKTMDEIILKIR
ncbi:hypothetical protein OAD02_01035 [Alphaproteobacteria bacterium]|nr:hypothetical protein [Alphaproteobacteria bacterium]MDB9871860.1 hypothetical protein [Alphaproteobacteria bacterium]